MTTDKKTDARKLDHATLEAMRLRAIEATKAGMKATDLALAYGVHRRTVFRWLADYYKGGGARQGSCRPFHAASGCLS